MKSCPSQEQLMGLLADQLDDTVRESLENHLGECESCQDRLQSMAVQDATEWESLENRLNTGQFIWPSGTYPLGPMNDSEVWPEIPGYEILSVLGQGGMGIVYKAKHEALNRFIALKQLQSRVTDTDELQRRFQAEAEALASLQHPNVVQIYEIFYQEDSTFLSLELVEGGSLAQRLQEGTLPPRHAAQLIEVLARTMQDAHDEGILHRDLKPANVLISEAGVPKITDFGLARKIDVSGDTKTGVMIGTPSYVAPEQARGIEDWSTPAVDIYALGAVLYETLTGRPPFRAVSAFETLRQVVQAEPAPPSQLQPELPRDLETICLKAMRKDPAQRYESCSALAEDLRRFLDGEPIYARRISWLQRQVKRAKRHPLITTLSTLLFVVILFLLFFWAKYTGDLRTLNDQLRQQTKIATENAQQAIQARDEKEEERRHAMITVSQVGSSLRRLCETTLATGQLQLKEPDPMKREYLSSLLKSYSQILERYDYPELRLEQSRSYHRLGLLTLSVDQKKAVYYLTRSAQIRESFETIHNRDPMKCQELATFLTAAGQGLIREKQWQRADKLFQKAFTILAGVNSPHEKGQRDILQWKAFICYQKATVRFHNQQFAEAKEILNQGISLLGHIPSEKFTPEMRKLQEVIEKNLELLSKQ